jgi:WD40 repeat protein/DNA-binding SARP family transcriptional activator/class 3 adenylate cyclase
VSNREGGGAVWRSGTQGSILGRMRGTEQAPQASDGTRVREQGRAATPDDDAEEIKTFLIADVRGYTRFTHERGDEAAATLAARFAHIVREQVDARDGSVIELRGDEALAVFRSPRQAIRTAVELQARLLQESLLTPDLPLPAGIGLDAGEAVQVEGGYRGGALNLAARLCGQAGPGEILCSESVIHLARAIDGISYVDRGDLHLKGLSDPVHVLAIASDGADVAERMKALAPRREARRAYGGTLQFRVLGPLEVDAGSGPVPLGGPKQRAVLAHLLIRANELVPADTLVDEVWGEAPPEKARNIIQTYVSHLRKALGHDRIQSHPPGYRLRLDPSELDSERFDALLRAAKKALPTDPNIAVGTLDDALALWRGPALADLADQPSLVAEAARLEDLRLEAQQDRIEGLLATGAQIRAIGELETVLTRHPWRESLWGLLMVALYREGRQAESLGAYQRAREILAEELGIDPSPELMRLHERVLKQDPGLDLRGEPLRGYRLLEKIEDGPTGVVFRAIQPHVERDVAVKIFHESIATDPAFVRRFDAEAQAAAALEHPHIAPIYDYWREPGRAYIVSRFLRGGSLRALEERGESLEQDRAVRVVEQIASALAFAHRQGLAHGGVRSSNVLFDGEGNVYLGDFRVGVGPGADPAEDVRELARLANGLFADDMPPRLLELVERAEVGTDVPDADAFDLAARRALEPNTVGSPRRVDERNPYKGLRAFTESDARDFFGRGELTQRLITRLSEAKRGSRFLAVVGPSGSGKSSAVRAGLVPAIRYGALGDTEDLIIAEMLPGAHPVEELAAALLRIAVRQVSGLNTLLDSGSRGLLEAVDLVAPHGTEVVLVVDQFEEVFTLAGQRERELFLESLRVATADPESRLRVIVTLRADFYDRPLIYPRFGELLAARTETVPPLTPDELEQAIRGPGERTGVRCEPGLVAEMIAEVAHQPGALPLLQYALTELFERRNDEGMTLSSYREIGGIAGALSVRADRTYEETDPAWRRSVKQVFLRLVTLGEGQMDTRRRIARSELNDLAVDPAAIDVVVDRFGRHRLLTFDREPTTREPTVEIAHEALLSSWGRLRIWIDDAREDLRQNQGLVRAGAEWRGSDRDPSFLLRGTRLDHVEGWAATTDLAIGTPERAYLKASVDQRDREREEVELQRERGAQTERRSARRLRGLLVVFAAAALIGGSLTLVATNQSKRAGREADRAEREARIATARELAAAATSNLDVDPELSVLLAVQAIKTTRSVDGTVLPEGEEALHRALVASRLELDVPEVGGLLAWSSKGVFVTEGPENSGMIDVRDARTGERVFAFKAHDGDINDVAFSPDGSRLASTGDDGRLKVWNPSTGTLVSSLSADGRVWGGWGPSFSKDGRLVAAAWSEKSGSRGEVRVLDLSTDRVVARVRIGGPIDTALSPDGKRLAVASWWSDEGNGAVFDVGTGTKAFGLRGPNCCIPPLSRGVSWSPDGRYIAASSESATRVWRAATGRLAHTLLGHTGYVLSVAWSPDSSRLVTGGSDGTAKVWEIGVKDARELWSLSGQETRSGIVGVAFSPNGTRVMAGDAAISGVKIWDLGSSGGAEWANLPASGDPAAEFMPDGQVVVARSPNDVHALTIWDLHTGRALRTLGPARDGFFGIDAFDISPSGESIGVGGWGAHCCGGEVARAWDSATGEELFRIWHRLDVNNVAFSPDGEYFVTASWDGTAKIIDQSGRVIRVLHDEGFNIRDARFSPDGLLVATAASAEEPGRSRVRIWDWQRGQLVRTIIANASVLEFDPSGPEIATAGPEGPVELWDMETGTPLSVLGGQSGGFTDVAFSPDGARVATASFDGSVRLFEAATGVQQLVLRGSGCTVQGVDFSPDGTKLASTSWCDGVRIWALDIDDLLEIARRVTRQLTDAECRQYLHEDRCLQA